MSNVSDDSNAQWRVFLECTYPDGAMWLRDLRSHGETSEDAIDYALEIVGELQPGYAIRAAYAAPESSISALVRIEPLRRASFQRARHDPPFR